MLLCEFHSAEIYQWYMTFYIDAYDEVMAPNAYSMMQHADGGLLTTKLLKICSAVFKVNKLNAHYLSNLKTVPKGKSFWKVSLITSSAE